ncbi:MAG: KH domain-containing protein [Oligosphaeraceae bacterium]
MAFSFLKKLFGAEAREAGPLPPMVDAPAPEETAAESAAPRGNAAPAPCLKSLQEFVAYVVTSLVDKPEEVSLSLAEKEDLSIIQIHCFKKDIGKVIGKSGKTISALRTLVSSAAARSHVRATVDVLDE